ncbi:MAG: hypothetical protein ACPHID_03220 [Thermoplasmatota archaeon]
MSAGIWAVIGVGALAATFCAFAVRDARAMKARDRQDATAIVAFWASVAAYLVAFTLLRLIHAFDLPGAVWVFYLQTVTGASTLISLSYIVVGVVSGHQYSRVGAELAGAVAVMVITLVVALGLEGPRHDPWSFEFLPRSSFVRYVIGTFYVVVPVAMAVLVAWATSREGDTAFRRRSLMFSASVVLLYVPNAIKYVTFVTGAQSLALAVVMMCGAFIGWRSYRVV